DRDVGAGVAVAEAHDAVLGDGGGDHAGPVGGGAVQGAGEGGQRGGDDVVVGGGVVRGRAEEGGQGAARGRGLRAGAEGREGERGGGGAGGQGAARGRGRRGGAEVRGGERECGDLRRGQRGGCGLGVRRNVRHGSIIRSNTDILEVPARPIRGA